MLWTSTVAIKLVKYLFEKKVVKIRDKVKSFVIIKCGYDIYAHVFFKINMNTIPISLKLSIVLIQLKLIFI